MTREDPTSMPGGESQVGTEQSKYKGKFGLLLRGLRLTYFAERQDDPNARTHVLTIEDIVRQISPKIRSSEEKYTKGGYSQFEIGETYPAKTPGQHPDFIDEVTRILRAPQYAHALLILLLADDNLDRMGDEDIERALPEAPQILADPEVARLIDRGGEKYFKGRRPRNPQPSSS